MKLYIFGKIPLQKSQQIAATLDRIAAGTNTDNLVVCVYFNHINTWNGGVTLAQNWITSEKLHPQRGKWRSFARYPVPQDVPPKFKLIRLLLIENDHLYPLTQNDIYNWIHTYSTFQDHLAFLFAHELHHFRRYHLNLHPGEGEQSANKWALDHIGSLGFRVKSVQQRRKRRTKKKRPVPFAKLFNPSDLKPGQLLFRKEKYIQDKLLLVEKLRAQPPGTRVRITYDPKKKYTGQLARIEKALNRNSYRIVIKTSDGKMWRWPMAWLDGPA